MQKRLRLVFIYVALFNGLLLVAVAVWMTSPRIFGLSSTSPNSLPPPLLCLVTTFKPGRTKRKLYSNTIRNWAALTENCGAPADIRTILYTANTSASRLSLEMQLLARWFSWTVIPAPRVNADGLPFIKEMYADAARRFPNCSFYGYVNGDILFNCGLIDTLLAIVKQSDVLHSNRTLIIGRRTNVRWKDINGPLHLPEDVTSVARRAGELFRIDAEDYFFIARNEFPWHRVPDLVIARIGYDNFLVATAISQNVSVIDATATLLAVHQTDFEGALASWKTNNGGFFNYHAIGRFNFKQGTTLNAAYETNCTAVPAAKCAVYVRRKIPK